MNSNTIVCDKNKEKMIRSLLKLYRKILHTVNNNLVFLDEEVYVSSRKHLSDIVEGLVLFESKKDEQKFHERVCVYYKDLELLKLLETVVIMVRDYPDGGRSYYKILQMLYFDNFDYDNDEIMSILEISRSAYYRLLKKAYICFYYHLIGVLRSENIDFHENAFPCNRF